MTSPLGSVGPALPKISRRNLVRAAGLGVGALAVPGVLTACSGGDDTTTPGSSASGVEGVEPKQLGTETTGINYAEGYVGPRARAVSAFGDSSTTFKVVVQQDATVIGDWNKNNYMTEWFEKRTGVKVEFTQVLTTASDGSTDMTKINAILASGDLPDAFLGLPFSNDQISLYGQQGIFLPLDDLIATYAPEMRQARTDYPDFAKLTAATDGKTYQFAGINDCFHCKSSPGRAWINTTYLDKVGAKMPTTTDELREVLKELKANDPSPKKNIIPFGSSVNDQVDQFVMNSFLYNPGGDINGGWLALNQGKVRVRGDQGRVARSAALPASAVRRRHRHPPDLHHDRRHHAPGGQPGTVRLHPGVLVGLVLRRRRRHRPGVEAVRRGRPAQGSDRLPGCEVGLLRLPHRRPDRHQ